MKEKSVHLSLGGRQILYTMRKTGKSLREVARDLNCNASTVFREERRNAAPRHVWKHWSGHERALYAQEKVAKRQQERVRARVCLLDRDAKLRERVLTLLEKTSYSPEAIAWMISSGDMGIRLSGKSIRRWVKKRVSSYQKYFPHRGKRYRKYLTPRNRKARQAAPEKQSIHERPSAANSRERLGDLELDLLVCSQSKQSILSVRDRRTRHCWIQKVESRESQTVRQAIISLINKLPPVIRTCTFDRGSEFAEVNQLNLLFGIENYFCDAYSAWQKGSVENQNKEIRRYIPKGTDLSTITDEQLQHIENLLNLKPRDCHHGMSAGDIWLIETINVRRMLH